MTLLALVSDVLLVARVAEMVLLPCWHRRRLALEALAVPVLVAYVAHGPLVHKVAVVAHAHLSCPTTLAPSGCRFPAAAMVAVIPGSVARLVPCFLHRLQLVARKLSGTPSTVARESRLRLPAAARLLIPAPRVLASYSTRHDANGVLKVKQCCRGSEGQPPA